MRRASWVVVIAGLFFASTIDAECPSSRSIGSYGFGAQHYDRVGSMRCVIRGIDAPGRLFVEDEADGRRHWVTVPDSAKVLAGHRNRAPFDGRKKLTIDDLAVGQRIQVSSLNRNGKIVTVRVIRPDKSAEPTGIVLADLASQP